MNAKLVPLVEPLASSHREARLQPSDHHRATYSNPVRTTPLTNPVLTVPRAHQVACPVASEIFFLPR